MAAVTLQVIPSFYTNFSKKAALFLQTRLNFVSEEYCFAHHDDKKCFLPACKYLIILHGNVGELLKKLDTFCFIYQHVDCLYTLFMYRFSGKVLSRVDNCLIIYRGLFSSTTQADEWTKTLEEKVQKKILSSFQKTKSTQTSGSVFVDRIEQLEKTKFELELIKSVDCFPDSHGNYTSNLVSFKIKYL